MRIIPSRTHTTKLFLFLLTLTAIVLLPSLVRYRNRDRLIPYFKQRDSPQQDSIPKIVHFITGQTDRKAVKQYFSRTVPFSFFNYLVLLAARIQIQPTQLFVHYYEEPNTFWWNQSKKNPEIQMTLVKSRLVEQMFSRNIDHHAHRADVLRLEILLQYGGIYLDTDVLALRSFEPLLNLNDVVMGYESDDKKKACNAVILAKMNSIFLKRWYDAYQSYDVRCWACHPVVLPATLASLYPNEIRMLPTEKFFRPSWSESPKFFQENSFNFTSNYVVHLWNKINQAHLNALTPKLALTLNNTFGRMIRHAIGEKRLQQLENIDHNWIQTEII